MHVVKEYLLANFSLGELLIENYNLYDEQVLKMAVYNSCLKLLRLNSDVEAKNNIIQLEVAQQLDAIS